MAANEDPKAVAELLWGLRKAPSRGPRPAFDVTQIADAAVKVADAEGLEAVSMQRVAAELGFTKMALYRYVNDKAELIAVMIEAAVGAAPDLSGIAGWRAKLEEYARELSAAWRHHPWLPSITAGDRVMGPRETAWPESALSALADTPLTERERLDAIMLVSNHIRATHAAAIPGTQTWTSGEAAPIMRDLLLLNADRFPLLATTHATPSATTTQEFGLHAILDGLEHAITQRTPKG
ncbi:TetR family transcriptional regulator [Nonomuraea longispora]|uniref:TetR family transcriptional regulator n=1 Tax=Nonomuraea longispora TaxID=1848320 RepID=A0A4V2XKX6_9ACTN|nr:TetR/AcrR family transcriptional regulator C-terminal domain-containing protein [Nonomuraea longispora]TDC07976.1 TetR family transcriptional regulator [Nonomuraea longispora]